ncbi:MAG: Plug domain-containing protein [Cellvibrio sp.]|uniref:TonB-dependent receptor n=1 Tax=Cellvibrio sp. TaxID=1965322 RepID=UPI0027209D00|nr:Plug domain-containing protein [Cellvibrio sp.]
MKELSKEPKSILFALGTLLYISTVWAADDLEPHARDKIKTTRSAVKKSAVETTTPSASIKADSSSLIVTDMKTSIGAINEFKVVTVNNKLSSPDAAVFENEKSKKAEAQPAVELKTVWVVANPIIEKNQLDSFSATSSVVTQDQVRDQNAIDLAAALRRTPGVQISRYNPVGAFGGDQGGAVFIRDMGASRPGSEIKLKSLSI